MTKALLNLKVVKRISTGPFNQRFHGNCLTLFCAVCMEGHMIIQKQIKGQCFDC
jgi:hypothetical protein